MRFARFEINKPRLDASIFRHSDSKLNATEAASTALSTSPLKFNKLRLVEYRKIILKKILQLLLRRLQSTVRCMD